MHYKTHLHMISVNQKSLKLRLNKLLDTKELDYVFLNAGILGEINLIEKIKFSQILEIYKINVLANKEILDFIIKKKIKTKLIIAISSGAALSPKIGWYLYCSPKSAFKFLIASANPCSIEEIFLIFAINL